MPKLTHSFLQNLFHLCRYAKSGNEVFLVELTKWAFHERSVLRATNLRQGLSFTRWKQCKVLNAVKAENVFRRN